MYFNNLCAKTLYILYFKYAFVYGLLIPKESTLIAGFNSTINRVRVQVLAMIANNCNISYIY